MTLTATISKDGGTDDIKTFDLTIKAKAPTDTEAVAEDKETLEIDFNGTDTVNGVTQDITLPTYGDYGTSISWSSDNTQVISVAETVYGTVTGTVYRPTYTAGNKTVTVTAKVYRDSASDTKDFLLTVLKIPATDTEAVAQDTTNLTIDFASGDEADSVTEDMAFPTIGSNGTSISWTSSNTSVVSNTGEVYRPSYTDEDKTVTVTASVYKNGISDVKQFTLTILKQAQTDTEAVTEDKADLELPFGGDDSAANVTQDLTLPTSGSNETTITWTSSDPIVISETGEVTRPTYNQGDAAIILTATIARGGAAETKTFSLVVTKLPDDDDEPQKENNKPADIVEVTVDGKKEEQAATARTERQGETTVTTITLDTEKMLKSMETEEAGSTVTIPAANNEANTVKGELTGDLVKAMEDKKAVVEVQTEKATYTLPAEEIKIETVTKQMGEDIELKDVKISVEIGDAPEEDTSAVENAARAGNMEIVAAPVSFKVTAASKNKSVEVDRFNSYVGRRITIPEGVDPSKITTGVVLNQDGTVSHVPTEVIIINGKYYAKINSLTNSTYSVIYNSKEFADVADHWSKEAVNDMGSRLVISGYDEDTFAPDQDITRAEFTTIVVRAMGLRNPDTAIAFSDVKTNAWYYETVRLGSEYGLINGYEDQTFRPNDKITREEAMTIIGRAMDVARMGTDISEGELQEQLSNYTDSRDIDDWAKESTALCIINGIVKGFEGKLTPNSNITRAETAAMVRRTLQQADLI